MLSQIIDTICYKVQFTRLFAIILGVREICNYNYDRPNHIMTHDEIMTVAMATC